MPRISIRAKIKNNHGPKVINVPEMHIDTNSKIPGPEGSRATGHGSGYGGDYSYGGSSSYESSPSYGGASGYESSSSYGSSSSGYSPSSYTDHPSGSYSAGSSSYGSSPATGSSYSGSAMPSYSAPNNPSYESQPSYGGQSSYVGPNNYGTQASYMPQASYNNQPSSQEYSSQAQSYGSSGSAYGSAPTYNEASPVAGPSYTLGSEYGTTASSPSSYDRPSHNSMTQNTRNQYGSSASSYSQHAASSAYPPMAAKTYSSNSQPKYVASAYPSQHLPQQSYQNGPAKYGAAAAGSPQSNSYNEAAALTSSYSAIPQAETYQAVGQQNAGYGAVMESSYSSPQTSYNRAPVAQHSPNAYSAASSKSYQTAAAAAGYNQAPSYSQSEQTYSPPKPYYESASAYGQHIGHEPIGYQPLEPGHTLLSASNDNYDGLSTISVASNPPKDYGYKSAHGASSYSQAPAYQPKSSQNSYSQPPHAYQPPPPQSSYGASQPQFDDNAGAYATMNQGNYGARASSLNAAASYPEAY